MIGRREIVNFRALGDKVSLSKKNTLSTPNIYIYLFSIFINVKYNQIKENKPTT